MSKKRWMTIIAITLSAIAAVIYGFMPKPVPVDLAKVSRGTMSVFVEEEGKTRVKEKFVISAPVAGYMRRINLDIGDPVKKGQVIAELEPLRSAVLDPRTRAAAEASVSAADAGVKAVEENIRAASAAYEYAKSNLDRMRKLYEAGYAAKEAFELSDTEAKKSEAALLSAKASLKAAHSEADRARAALKYSAEGSSKAVSLLSPVSGSVLKMHRESESAVNSGEPLIDVGDPKSIEVRVEVLSSDAVKIKPGVPVIFERWGGDKALSGRVRVIEPAGFTKISSLGVEEQRVVVIADVTPTEEWLKLGDGYRVEAKFIIWEEKDILQIPASALFRKGVNWAVFVVKTDRAELRQVQIGRRNGITAQVLSGLSEGENVITHPDDLIKEGVRIKKRTAG